MKILVSPKGWENPYQELLYAPMRREGAVVTYIKPVTPSATLNVVTWLPLFAWYRLRGYRTFHLHWANAFALLAWPWSTKIGKRLAYLQFVILIMGIKAIGYKLVWTAHNALPHDPTFYDDVKARKMLVNHADLVIAHAQQTFAELAEMGVVPPKGVVIPHGSYYGAYPDTMTRAEARDALGIEDEFTYLYVGQIRPYKGVGQLVDAFQKIETPEMKLVIAGKCSDTELDDKILESSDSGDVIFHDKYVADEDLQKYMNAADVVVLPFKKVTTSGSALLALSFGKAVIVPAIGDLKSLPDSVCYKYDPQDTDALRRTMEYVAGHREELAEKSKSALEYAKSLAWPEISRRTLRSFQELFHDEAGGEQGERATPPCTESGSSGASLSRKILVSTSSQVASQGISAVLGVVGLKIVTNALGVGSYGIYVTALMFVSTFALLTDLGVNAITAREIAKRPQDADEIIGHNMGLRLFLGLVLAPVISILGLLFYPHASTELRVGIAALTTYIFFDAVRSVALAYFTAKVRNEVTALVTIVQTVVYFAGILVVALAGWKLYGMYSAYVAANIVGMVVAVVMARKYVRVRPIFNPKAWWGVFGMSLSLGAIQVINLLYLKADSLLLSIYKGPVEVGIYGVAYSIIITFMTLPSYIMTALTPSMAVTKGRAELEEIVEKAFSYMVLLACLLAVGSFAVREDVISAVSSSDFLAASTPFAVLGLASAFSYLNYVFGFASVAVNKHHKIVFVSLAMLLLNIALNVVLIPLYSIVGAAWATALCEALSLVFTYLIFSRETGVKPRLLRHSYKPLTAAAAVLLACVCGAGIFSTGSVIGNLLAESVFVTVAYAAIVALFRGFPNEVTTAVRKIGFMRRASANR